MRAPHQLARVALLVLLGVFRLGARAAGDEQPSAGSSLEPAAPAAAAVPVPRLLAPRLVAPSRPRQVADAHEEQVKEYLDWYFENNALAAAAPSGPQPAGQQPQSSAGAGRPCVHRRKAEGAVHSTSQAGPCSLGRDMEKKRYLVVLPAGDGFDANRWMPDPAAAAFDLIIIHFGKNQAYECWQCRKMYRGRGAKWRLVYQLFSRQDWLATTEQYKAIMVPDDDLVMDTCMLNRAFQLFERFDLLIAQPSVCNVSYAAMIWPYVTQQRDSLLRYVTFIEVQAPIFQMHAFNNFIGPSMAKARIGWGLDSLWPFLLKYPRDRLAIIDDVCMIHPNRVKEPGTNVYDAAAGGIQGGWREEFALYKQWGYSDAAVQALGWTNKTGREMQLVLGSVPQAPPHRLRDETGGPDEAAELCDDEPQRGWQQRAVRQAPQPGAQGAHVEAEALAGTRALLALVPGAVLLLLWVRRQRAPCNKRL